MLSNNKVVNIVCVFGEQDDDMFRMKNSPVSHLVLLSPFYEKAATGAMTRIGWIRNTHCTVPESWTDTSNDCVPQTCNVEDKYVIMLCGVRIEMVMWNAYGEHLGSSSWTTALNHAVIASYDRLMHLFPAQGCHRHSHGLWTVWSK